MENQETINYF